MSYRRRTSPLHAARAAASSSYCAALGVVALALDHPLVLATLVLVLLTAGGAAGAGREIGRAALYSAPLAGVIAIVNALVTRDGLSVVVRLGQLPILGHTDITLEATAYGGVLGLRAIALILCGALYTTAVDPDEVLRLFRRISFRSALSASIATRLVPVLARDARRLADAQRCRPGRPPSRLQLLRAASTGALERALDVAAALEVRGYGSARRPLAARRPWARADAAFFFSAIALVALAVAARAIPLAPFRAYPSLYAPVGPRELVLAVALGLIALLPFALRRGLER